MHSLESAHDADGCRARTRTSGWRTLTSEEEDAKRVSPTRNFVPIVKGSVDLQVLGTKTSVAICIQPR